ncbi:MAG: gamma-glutamyl-gamma-aminobutyrate hydrolase family protein [Thermoanaerobaculia bacterium]|nr:gamma-glutamyl-gamma-aminobutyrate hydrolase family protein [Thermoanaerobaculia bacterium]
MTKVLVCCSRDEKAPPYVEALTVAGFETEEIRIVTSQQTPPERGADQAVECDGVLLCGGPDLDPEYYGEEPHPNANLSIEPERDALEWRILEAVRERKTPLFGVCRGMQMVNAFLGGTLWQDLRLQWPGSMLHDLSYPRDALIHTVDFDLDETAELGRLIESEVSLVNSRHHQAVKDLASALAPVAHASDGVLEALVGEDPRWWVWGVQWHPENLISLESQRALWQRFRRRVHEREEQKVSA